MDEAERVILNQKMEKMAVYRNAVEHAASKKARELRSQPFVSLTEIRCPCCGIKESLHQTIIKYIIRLLVTGNELDPSSKCKFCQTVYKVGVHVNEQNLILSSPSMLEPEK